MAGPVITIHGYDRLAAVLAEVEREANEATEQAVGAYVSRARDRLEDKPYPPELPGQRYIRTYNLKHGFRDIHLSRGEWLIFNEMEYSSYVVGTPDEQAAIHAGRWWVAREVVEERVPDLEDVLAARYQAIIDRRLATV